ncbi:MAG: transposase [Egibacteraceae bacterium]
MDMSPAYANPVREHASQATIVWDPFHVVALANTALDEARRAHWSTCAPTRAPTLPASSKAPAGRCTNAPRACPSGKPRRWPSSSAPAAGCGAPTSSTRRCARCSPPA